MELEDDESADLLFGDGSDQTAPRDLVTPATVFNVSFHPTAPILAVGMVNGVVDIHEFRRNETRPVSALQMHTKGGVSAMEFTRSGTHLATVGSDRHIKILDCTSQQVVIDIKPKNSPHKDALSSLCICTTTMLAVGDDDGRISIWDMRQQRAVHSFYEHADQVRGMIFFEGNRELISCSADTTIGCFDIRAAPHMAFSDKRKDELNCLIFLPATNNIVCGTDTGLLPIWRYGSWTRPYDVHAKHPKECEALITYNDNIFFSGAYDGIVRVVQHNPVRRVLTNFGTAFKSYNTITSLSISHDRNLLASAGNDKLVSFHDIEFLGREEELDLLRSRAERVHMATIRKAVAEDADAANAEVGSSRDSEEDWAVEEDGAAISGTKPMIVDPDKPLDRATKRERMAASRWLKKAQKERINFLADTRRKRTKGFWKDLTD